jgi:uncharacterized Tic20 family protein
MKDISEKIKDIRTAKGYSQEELANKSKLNLRTIQRIENQETEPRGKTLQLICLALGTTTEEILNYGTKEDKSFMVYYHFSVLALMIFPLGNIILPFILWVAKKDTIKNIKQDGKPLLNFQIVWTILTYTILMTGIMGKIIGNDGTFSSLSLMHYLYTYLILLLLNIVLAVTFAFRNARGKMTFRTYPSIIPFLR